MADSQNGCPHSQPDSKNLQNKSSTSADEINLVDYFVVLWRRKYFIVLGTVLPTLAVGLVLFFLPGDYKVTYSYDLGLGEKDSNSYDFGLDQKDYKMLLDEFYGPENGEVLSAKLKEAGFDEHAMATLGAGIKLEVSGTFLVMTITSSSSDDVRKISPVARYNFEEVLPMYSVKRELGDVIAEFKMKIADIEEHQFDLELELERKKAVLAKLKKLEPVESNQDPGNIILQFKNPRKNSEYLPIAYQVQVTDVNIINIEETIIANARKCEYYNTLQSLNKRLLEELSTDAAQTLSTFHASLANVLSENEDSEATGYLKAFIRRIESVMETTKPVVVKPGVYLVSKGVGKKTATTGAVLIIVTILAAFLLENLPPKQARAA